MLIREATFADVDALHQVRIVVRENRLSRPDLITTAEYANYLTERGKGWLCEKAGVVLGFAIIDLVGNNIWALFVHPDYEGQGVGRQLHDTMLCWFFAQTKEMVWLTTAPDTRAAQFYRAAGWIEKGLQPNGELRFEMPYGRFA